MVGEWTGLQDFKDRQEGSEDREGTTIRFDPMPIRGVPCWCGGESGHSVLAFSNGGSP
jgi:hypothetical protein